MLKPRVKAGDAVGAAGRRPAAVDWALVSLALAMLLSSLGTSIASVGLPTLAQAYQASFQAVQWVVLAYLIAITTLIVSVGWLGDVIGRRRLLLVGIGLFTTASALCGAAPTLGALIAARVAQGLGAAIMMALALALVGEAVAKERRGSAMGLLGSMSAIGTALGPSLGGLLIAELGWRAIFWFNLPLGVLAGLLAYRYLPGDGLAPRANLRDFDFGGMSLLAVTLAAYALAMTAGQGGPGWRNGGLLLLALVAGGFFVWLETRVASPLIRLGMFRDPVLSAGLTTSALVATVIMATLVVGPFYLARTLGLDAMLVGLLMSAGPAAAALGGVPAGRLVDRLGAPPLTLVGLAGMAAGSSMLWLLPPALGAVAYVVPLVIITTSYALFQTANNTAVAADARPDQRGVISGMLSLSRNLGLITGASLMGAVFAYGARATDVTLASAVSVAAGMQMTFAVAMGLICLAIAIAWAGRRRLLPAPADVAEAASSMPGGGAESGYQNSA
ncbi:MFS transporter [Chitinimonas viridis]|uniref:MFS transporter n=1 Tax=Chitinimonas viridis TaxID=664880 RepID=A0ABT8B0V2_9NEIS|nr:MFS transporter [Chitinimonas viridis]MDN3575858.1 MFS transporter [Chitinimonas viridis]